MYQRDLEKKNFQLKSEVSFSNSSQRSLKSTIIFAENLRFRNAFFFMGRRSA